MRDPDIMLRYGPFAIERRVLPADDDLAPGQTIVGAFIDGKLIGRCVEDELDLEEEAELFSEPRTILYLGFEQSDGSLKAYLFAECPEEPEAWRDPGPAGDEDVECVPLGVVVRLPQDRARDRGEGAIPGAPIAFDGPRHLLAILRGEAVPVIERVLHHL